MVEDKVKELYKNICNAFADKDIEAAIGYFSDSPDMVKISNGNVLRGKEELGKYWRQLIGNAKNIEVSMDDVEVHTIDDENIWATANEYIAFDGNSQKAVVSNIFVLTEEGWKILLDHTTYLH